MFFRAWTAGSGRELRRTDGTYAGTTLVKDIALRDIRAGSASSSPSFLTATGSRHVFFAATSAGDGTSPGARLVADLQPGAAGSNPRSLVLSSGRLLLVAGGGRKGPEPWVLLPGASARRPCRRRAAPSMSIPAAPLADLTNGVVLALGD